MFGNLQQMAQKDSALRSCGEELQANGIALREAQKELQGAKSKLAEGEREIRHGELAMDLLYRITSERPWARSDDGNFMCFYCRVVEAADHTVAHRNDCDYARSREFFMEVDAARAK